VPLSSAGTYGRMGAPAMELLNALNPCVCLRDGGQGFVGGCLARAQCEPNARAMELMFRAGLMVTARCSRFKSDSVPSASTA
jgi:hypothetical protein